MADGLSDVPVPDLEDPLYAPYWAGTRAARLMIQRCGACRTPRWPPRHMCPACGSLAVEWAEHGARGTLFSWTVVGRATARGYAEVPYAVGIVTLDDAPSIRLVGTIVDVDLGMLAVGFPLQARFVPAGPAGEMTLVQWEPAAGRER